MTEDNRVPPAEIVKDEDTVEKKSAVDKSDKKNVSVKKNTKERWWSIKGPSHSIVGTIISEDIDGNARRTPSMVSMNKYTYTCDLETEAGKQLSKDFKTSGAAKSNLFIICDKDDKSEEGRIAAKEFRRVVDQVAGAEKVEGMKHLATIFTEQELEKHGINANHPVRQDLMAALYVYKSFAPESEYDKFE